MKYVTATDGSVSLVSPKDYAYLQNFVWRVDVKGYFCARSSRLRMNRVVAERAGMDMSGPIDHKNRNKADNRRSNLRPATNGKNRANSKLNANSKSGFKGVHLRKRRDRISNRKVRSDCLGNRWTAQINVNGKKLWLGDFPTPEEAHAAYAQAARKHFGEFASP